MTTAATQSPVLLPSTAAGPTVNTPSGLTPTTRSEAEAAFTHNSITQTDSAAPDPAMIIAHPAGQSSADELVQQVYRRRPGVLRASSANYATALQKSQQYSAASASSDMSVESQDNAGGLAGETVAFPTASFLLPSPGQGVVPLNYGSVGSTAAAAGMQEPLKTTRSRGLSLSQLAQQQGWSEQDFKRVFSADLLNGLAQENRPCASSSTG